MIAVRMMFQSLRKPPCWAATMALVRSEPATNTTVTVVKPSTAS